MIYVLVVYMKQDDVVKTLTHDSCDPTHARIRVIHSFVNDARHSAPGRRASLTRGAGSRGASTAVKTGVKNPVARRV